MPAKLGHTEEHAAATPANLGVMILESIKISAATPHQRDAAASGGHCVDDLIPETLRRQVLATVDGVQEVSAQQAALLELADQLHHVSLRQAHLAAEG